ncbi:glycerol-3-phosphate 1-O-acyltransferase [Skermania piniformis]|uniref:Glycerol-3-phosphate 1-O-acyltransferase n=1 Tax=Skermania pinensis TaxID=39122 RepID=A0ABX8S6H4_9ACTN|nr:glycerol-3-phosphate 1-O-acyltransferase [Skermania piniformis]QXQ13409.1 glycerol-3-phosphate 1-O-acyltransferase [Skermania piniformis]
MSELAKQEPDTTRPAPGSYAEPAGPVVALVDASTKVERELIEHWLTDGGLAAEHRIDSPATLVDLDTDAIADRLVDRTDDPLVLPVRVVWLPPERDGVRRTRLRDLATLGDPRNPNRLAQRWIVQRAPDRHRVLTGQPARLGELRARHASADNRSRTGQRSDDSRRALARSIVRAGVLALERAERALIGDRYKVPQMVVEEIMDSQRFRDHLNSIADQIGISHAEAHRRGEAALRELVAAQSRVVSDLFTQAMRPVHASAWKVDADEAELIELQRLNRRYPLVFLPSHRSYVDAFVLGDVLAHNDFPPNHLIGGANLNFWPMGPVARRAGTIFIRRSFNDDEIYKAALEEYFGYLLARRFNMEWYFEGGRTRTGKLRPPRYGLLNYLAAAIRQGRVDDAKLVPVSITYERLNELGAIADEQLGAAKKSESLAWLARYIRNQQNSAGRVYVRFGTPLSTRDLLVANGDPMDTPNTPDIEARRRKAVQKLAFEIAVGINDVTPITLNALVTLALLGVHDRALTRAEVRAVLEPVLRYIERRDLPRGELGKLRDDSGLAIVLDQLSTARVVDAYYGGLEPVYSINSGQHLVAAFYRNSAVHWFVNRALLEMAILAAVESGYTDPLRTGWDEANQLRDLLKFEFFFPDREQFEEQMTQEMLLVDPAWLDRAPSRDEILAALADTGFMMAHRVLRSFVGAQQVVADRLTAHDPHKRIDRKEFVDECVAIGKQLLLQDRLQDAESVSSELFGSALQLADNRNLLGPVSADTPDAGAQLRRRRLDFAGELHQVSERIALAAKLDASSRKEIR